jgi:glycosyltransferase involved in cell wall biosynthesis
MQISVVVPLFNEDESLPELCAWIQRVMEAHSFTYEVIMVDDGSKDRSWEVIRELSNANPHIKGIRFRRNYGKSAALNVGFAAAVGDVIITMDADMQDSPDEIPELYDMIKREGYDLVSGWKQKRFDPITKTVPTKLFNAAARQVSGIYLHDFNCGLKAYRHEVVKSIEVYGEMHRYIPILAKRAGFAKIGEKVVQHRERKYGTTKFGLERFINGFLDLLTVSFMTRFSKRPMHLFGALGALCFMLGFSILIWLTVAKIFYNEYGMASKPSFFFGITLFIFGSQLFLTGFLAELISRSSADRNNYLIAEKLHLDE